MQLLNHETSPKVCFAVVDAVDAAIPGLRWTDSGTPPHNDRMITLAERDGGWLCFYCEKRLAQYDRSGPGWVAVARIAGFPDQFAWMIADGFVAPHIEHIIPRSRGGSNQLSNLTLACADCNFRKRARMPLEFLSS